MIEDTDTRTEGRIRSAMRQILADARDGSHVTVSNRIASGINRCGFVQWQAAMRLLATGQIRRLEIREERITHGPRANRRLSRKVVTIARPEA